MNQSALTVAPRSALGKPPVGSPAAGDDAPNEIDAGASDTDVPPRATRFGAIDIALLALAAGSLGIACVLMSRAKYYWGDEIFSWTLVTDPSLRHMVSALWQAADGAPPLFYVVGRLWTDVAGTGDLALRLLSCLGFVAALGLMWATLRRAFGTWPAAIASVTVFAASELVQYQISEARFYGLLMALVACAVFLYARAVAEPRYSTRLFVLTALVHAALLYTHLYGALYSGVILAAWIAADRIQKRPLDWRYLAVPAGWVTFIPWIPALRHLAAVGQPRNWLPVPNIPDLINTYTFTVQYIALILVAIVVLGIATRLPRVSRGQGRATGEPAGRDHTTLTTIGVAVAALAVSLAFVPWNQLTFTSARAAWTANSSFVVLLLILAVGARCGWLWIRRHRSVRASPAAMPADEALLIVGAALFTVPIVAYCISHVGPPIFYDRYFLPASLGLSPVIAYFAKWCTTGSSQAESGRRADRASHLVLTGAWALLVGWIAIQPAWGDRHLRPQPRPGLEVEKLAPPGATVVVEGLLDFLPLRRYQRRHDITYVYPMDWAAVIDPASSAGSVVEYNLVANWKRVGYLDATTVGGAQVPCEGRPFVVLHSWRLSWYNDRIAHDPAFATLSIGQSWSTWEASGIIFVEPRKSQVPAMCRGIGQTQGLPDAGPRT